MNPVARLLRVFLLNALAILAFVLLAMTNWFDAGLVCAGIALAILAWWGADAGTAGFVSVQPLVAGGLLVAWRDQAEGESALIVVAGAILLVVVSQERVLRLFARARRVRAANLPEYEQSARLVVSHQTVFTANLAAVVVLGFFTGLTGPPWAMVVVALAAGAVSGYFVIEALRTREQFGVESDYLVTCLKARAPEFLIHFSGPAGSAYQLTMWLPYFERIGRPYFVVLREGGALAEVREATTAPVLVCGSIASLESTIVPSLKAAFYVNNGMKNSHAVRFAQLTHIQLLHGDSDKAPSFSPVTAMFDRIFVAGQAGIDRYAANGVDIPGSKFSIVGRPQVEQVQRASAPISEVTSPVVLYAPTWRGQNLDADYCSLPIGAGLVAALLGAGATVILRPHPYSSRDPESAAQLAVIEKLLADDLATSGRNHVWGTAASIDMTLFDCFNASDALVADVSSVVSDYLFSEKPIAIVEVLPVAELDFVDSFPVARAAYLLRQDGSNWTELLDELLHADSMREQRLAVKTYYLGDFPSEDYAEAFVVEARRFL